MRTLYAEIEIIYDREHESSESFTVHLSQDKFMIAEVKVGTTVYTWSEDPVCRDRDHL